MDPNEQQRVREAMSSAIEEIRHQAMRRLPELFDTVPTDLLVLGLGDESWRVRKCAADIMAGLPVSDDLVDQLVRSLGDQDNAGLRNSATEVLIRFGEAVVPALCDALGSADKDVRKFAADILGCIGETSAVSSLVESLNGDEDDNVRAAVAEALGLVGSQEAVPSLIRALKSGGLIVQLSSLDALVRMKVELPIELLEGLMVERTLRPHLYQLMGLSHEDANCRLLFDGIRSNSRVEREAAARALVIQFRRAEPGKQDELRSDLKQLVDEKVRDGLLGMLRSATFEVREAAIVIAGLAARAEMVPEVIRLARDERLHDAIQEMIQAIGPSSVDMMIGMLDDIGRIEKTLVLDLLGAFSKPESVPWIVEQCYTDEPEVSKTAQQVLGRFDSPQVIPPLVDILKKGESDGSWAAVRSLVDLGRRHHDDVFREVEPLLKAEQTDVRAEAAEVLCGMARNGDLNAIVAMVSDQDYRVRKVAIDAMARLGDRTSIDRIRMALADEHPLVRAEAARALGGLTGDGIEDSLMVALRDAEPTVIRSALNSLAQAKSTDAQELLVQFTEHENGSVALESVRLLNRYGWSGHRGALLKAFGHKDSEVVKEAISACAQFPIEEVRPALLRALKDERWDVRFAVVKAAGMLGDSQVLEAVFAHLPEEPDKLVRESMERLLRDRDRPMD